MTKILKYIVQNDQESVLQNLISIIFLTDNQKDMCQRDMKRLQATKWKGRPPLLKVMISIG